MPSLVGLSALSILWPRVQIPDDPKTFSNPIGPNICALGTLKNIGIRMVHGNIFNSTKTIVINTLVITIPSNTSYNPLWLVSSVTRLGDFGNLLATNLLTFVAQKDCRLVGDFEKNSTNVKLLQIFLGNLWKHLGKFLPPSSGHTASVVYKQYKLAVVVAQLVEQSVPKPEVRGSNPVIGKNLLNICLLSTVYWKDENKEKEAGNCPFFKKYKLT